MKKFRVTKILFPNYGNPNNNIEGENYAFDLVNIDDETEVIPCANGMFTEGEIVTENEFYLKDLMHGDEHGFCFFPYAFKFAKHIPMSEFWSQYNHRLVKVDNDNEQYGDYRLIETERDIVQSFVEQGMIPVTIWNEGDDETEESVTFEFENSFTHPMVAGYFILSPE